MCICLFFPNLKARDHGPKFMANNHGYHFCANKKEMSMPVTPLHASMVHLQSLPLVTPLLFINCLKFKGFEYEIWSLLVCLLHFSTFDFENYLHFFIHLIRTNNKFEFLLLKLPGWDTKRTSIKMLLGINFIIATGKEKATSYNYQKKRDTNIYNEQKKKEKNFWLQNVYNTKDRETWLFLLQNKNLRKKKNEGEMRDKFFSPLNGLLQGRCHIFFFLKAKVYWKEYKGYSNPYTESKEKWIDSCK